MGAGQGQDQETLTVAAQAAARYARRVFWADREELVHEAVVAALKAHVTWDDQCGIARGAYLWRACVLHLSAFCWKQSAPVHAPHHKRKELRGVHREEVTETSWVSSEDPHSLLDEKQWTAGVREQVDFLLDGLGENSGVAARVIVLEESPAAVAYACELPVGYVYRIARTGRRLLADNAMLHSMLKERS